MLFNGGLWGGAAGIAGTTALSARKLIYDALRLLQVMRPGQGPNVSTLNDGLEFLNQVIDLWSIDRLMIRAIARDLYEVLPGQPNVSISAVQIEAAGVVWSNPPIENQLALLPTNLWPQVSMKQTLGLPQALHLEMTSPQITAWIYPVPNQNYGLAIYNWVTLSQYADLNTVYGLPPGYPIALRYALADHMAPAFEMLTKAQRIVYDRIAEKARLSKMHVMSFNAPHPVARLDGLCAGGYNVYDDQWQV